MCRRRADGFRVGGGAGGRPDEASCLRQAGRRWPRLSLDTATLCSPLCDTGSAPQKAGRSAAVARRRSPYSRYTAAAARFPTGRHRTAAGVMLFWYTC